MDCGVRVCLSLALDDIMQHPRKKGYRSTKRASGAPVISIAEYRRIMNDKASSDTKIVERLQYLEALCRNIIRIEIEKYVGDREN